MGNNILPEVEPYGSLFFLHHYKGITEQQKKISLLKEIISDNGVAYVVFGSKSTDRFVPYEIINENDIANCKVKGYFPGYVYPEEDESGQKRLFLFKIVDISHVSRSYLNTDKGGASAEHVDKTNAGYKCYTQTDYNRYKHIDYIYLFRISLLKTLIRHNGTATIEYGKIKWNCFKPVVLLNEDDKEHCVVKGYLPGYIPYFSGKEEIYTFKVHDFKSLYANSESIHRKIYSDDDELGGGPLAALWREKIDRRIREDYECRHRD